LVCGLPHGCCCVCSTRKPTAQSPHPPTASIRLACWSAWVLLLARPHGRSTAADPLPPLAAARAVGYSIFCLRH
jgi:hypothetical protein